MSDILILSFFALLIFGIIGYILMHQLLKYLKGTIRIHIPRKIYTFGETVQGIVTLKAKKTLKIDSIELHVIANIRERIHQTTSSATRYKEIFRYTQLISSQEILQEGTQKKYDLSFTLPEIEELPSGIVSKLEGNMDKGHEGFNKSSRMKKNIRWNIKILAKCDGVDLYKRQSIEIRKSEK